MLKVLTDGTIQLTRGDTARLSVTIQNDSVNDNYEMSELDILRLTIKKSVNDKEPLVQKISTGSSKFHIEPNDTKDLLFGKYVYDVELTTSSGDVYTVVGPSVFEITKEVT